MDRRTDDSVRRWMLASGTALALATFILPLFRGPPSPPPVGPGPAAERFRVMLRPANGTDAAFDEKATLTDPAPQFLPTKWNATQKELAGPEPGASFESYPPKLGATSAKTELKLVLPMPVALPDSAVEALFVAPPGSPMLGFGRAATPAPTLSRRGAYVEIVAEGTGLTVLRQALPDAKPPGDGAWQPLEFSIAVDAAGLVGPIVVKRRSDVEGVDSYFQRYLAQTLRVGQRLSPGFYRISVGP